MTQDQSRRSSPDWKFWIFWDSVGAPGDQSCRVDQKSWRGPAWLPLQELLCHSSEMLRCWNLCHFISMATSWSFVSNPNKELSGRWYFLRHLCLLHSDGKICSGSRDKKDNKPQSLSLIVFCKSSGSLGQNPLGSTKLFRLCIWTAWPHLSHQVGGLGENQ